MKRRKKIWIACAALAVVALLYAIALTQMLAPYAFLNGATRERMSMHTITQPGKPQWSLTGRRYLLKGSLESVAEEARKELTAEEGWVSQTTPEGHLRFRNSADKKIVALSVAPYPSDKGDKFVIAVMSEPSRPLDRVVVWILDR